MGNYRHLTPEDRVQIAAMRAANWRNGAFAAAIGKSPSMGPFSENASMLFTKVTSKRHKKWP